MKQTIDIPHVYRPPAVYTNLHCEVEGEPGSKRIVWLYVIDPERAGGDKVPMLAAESERAARAVEGAVVIDYWEVRFPEE